MGAQHTSGPWFFGLRDDGGRHKHLATIYGVPTLPTEDGKGQNWGYISAVKPCWEGDDAEMLANASLMAAAPDLLAALRECAPYVARYESENMSNVALDVLSRAQAAIAKATGEA